MKISRVLFVFLALAMALYSCKEDNSLNGKVDFDREAMLQNWADHILIPAYADFEKQALEFKQKLDVYSSSLDSNALVAAQKQLEVLYTSFQHIKAFEVGPAEAISLKASINTYPTDTAKVQYNIRHGITDLGPASQLVARGLPALDYLLFGAEVDVKDTSVVNYMKLLTQDIMTMASILNSQWVGYRAHFVSAKGSDIGSSLGQMVNAINKDYELIKNAKIGFPAGKKTLGKLYPEACEAYYSGISLELAQANVESIHGFFKGDFFDGSQKGLSLQDYLQAVDAKSQSGDLDLAIDEQFSTAIRAIKDVQGPLSAAVLHDKDGVDDAYLAIQRNVVLLKTDMPSALGVLITYQDNDGD